VGQVVASGRRRLVKDARNEQDHYRLLDIRSGFNTRSILCVPLRAPYIRHGLAPGAEEVIGAVQALNKRDGSDFNEDDITLFEAFASQAATALQMSRLHTGMQRLFRDTISLIVNLVDARDPYTRGHSQRVSVTAAAVAGELGLSRADVYEIEIGGILHDVGKIGVSDAVLNKPDKLNDSEYEQMKRHPQIGYQALQTSRELRCNYPKVLSAILEHHRRLDGSGYPEDILPEEVSLVGRIVAVADVFDALTSRRPYRDAWSSEDALAYMRERAGTEFDPACVRALEQARNKGLVRVQAEWDTNLLVATVPPS
jgi:HD-GYP domain-containing protein (c-di-GMP phosphodiesterase class II)